MNGNQFCGFGARLCLQDQPQESSALPVALRTHPRSLQKLNRAC